PRLDPALVVPRDQREPAQELEVPVARGRIGALEAQELVDVPAMVPHRVTAARMEPGVEDPPGVRPLEPDRRAALGELAPQDVSKLDVRDAEREQRVALTVVDGGADRAPQVVEAARAAYGAYDPTVARGGRIASGRASASAASGSAAPTVSARMMPSRCMRRM